jgi:hypothetical protein
VKKDFATETPNTTWMPPRVNRLPMAIPVKGIHRENHNGRHLLILQENAFGKNDSNRLFGNKCKSLYAMHLRISVIERNELHGY